MSAFPEAAVFGFVPDPSIIPRGTSVPRVEKWIATKVKEDCTVPNKNVMHFKNARIGTRFRSALTRSQRVAQEEGRTPGTDGRAPGLDDRTLFKAGQLGYVMEAKRSTKGQIDALVQFCRNGVVFWGECFSDIRYLPVSFSV